MLFVLLIVVRILVKRVRSVELVGEERTRSILMIKMWRGLFLLDVRRRRMLLNFSKEKEQMQVGYLRKKHGKTEIKFWKVLES